MIDSFSNLRFVIVLLHSKLSETVFVLAVTHVKKCNSRIRLNFYLRNKYPTAKALLLAKKKTNKKQINIDQSSRK